MEKEEIVKKLTKCERTGKQRDGTNYVYPNNGKEETNITTPTEMDVSEQKWTLVRAFKNEEEADEEMERLVPLRQEFKVRVIQGKTPIFPWEVQIHKKSLSESLS